LQFKLNDVQKEKLQHTLDYSKSKMVSIFQMNEFLKGFGNFHSCLYQFCELVGQPWYHSYMSDYAAKRFLELEPPGTFIVVNRMLLPSCFTLVVNAPETSYFPIYNSAEQFKMKCVERNIKCETLIGSNRFNEDGIQFIKPDVNTLYNKLHNSPLINGQMGRQQTEGQLMVIRGNERIYFESVLDLAKNQHKIINIAPGCSIPFVSTLLSQPWFYFRISGPESRNLLSGQVAGTFLVRFSLHNANCLAAAYVTSEGTISQSLIEKTVDNGGGFRQKYGHQVDSLPLFKTMEQFIEGYSSVLSFPFITTNTIMDDISHAARAKVPETKRKSKETERMEPVIELTGNKKVLALFGTDLVHYMNNSIDSSLCSIPTVIQQAIMFIYKNITTEGLFRKSASTNLISDLISSINKGQHVDFFEINDVHATCQILKAYLRQLPNPLIPFEFFHHFVAIEDSTSPQDIRSLVQALPKYHCELLRYVLKILVETAKKETENLMGMKAISLCMGPNITQSSNTTNSTDPSSMEQTRLETERVTASFAVVLGRAYDVFPDLDDINLVDIVYGDLVLSANRKQIKKAEVKTLVDGLYMPPIGLNEGEVRRYRDTFLLTYRSFMSSTTLLEHLIERFKILQSLNNHPNQKNMVLWLCQFFRSWSRQHNDDMDQNFVNKFQHFVEDIVEIDIAKTILVTCYKKIIYPSVIEHSLSTSPPNPVGVPKPGHSFNIYSLKSLEIARQMTLLEFELFVKIKPYELIGTAWTGKDGEKNAPNIWKFTNQFNKFALFVCTSIVKERSSVDMKHMMDKFLKIAINCKRLNNFTGAQEIFAAFSHAQIDRLPVMKKIRKSEAYLELEKLFNADENFKNYRHALEEVNPPLVPFMGHLQQDLTFIDQGQSTKLETGKINFLKLYGSANVIKKIVSYQQTPYNLTVVPSIRDWLCEFSNNFDEEELWQRSYEIVPRGKGIKPKKKKN